MIASLFSTTKTLQISQQQARISAEQLNLAREGQVTERFTKAIDQLGDQRPEIKLGGIYALERIANESRYDHLPIIELLTAYVRENAPTKALQMEKKPSTKDHVKPEIQAIMLVLGRRNVALDSEVGVPTRLQLANTDLSGVDLSGGIFESSDFSKAILVGARLSAKLNNVKLFQANLTGADLNRADLEFAQLSQATLVNVNLNTLILRRRLFMTLTSAAHVL